MLYESATMRRALYFRASNATEHFLPGLGRHSTLLTRDSSTAYITNSPLCCQNGADRRENSFRNDVILRALPLLVLLT